TPAIIFLTLVGLMWLGVGVFVLFKQGSRSPFVLHFATVCLAAFMFHAYAPLYTGQDFDLAVQLLDTFAFAFFVSLFLHFCLRYPVHSNVLDREHWKTYSLYAPAAVISMVYAVFVLGPHLLPEGAAIALNQFTAANKIIPVLNQVLLYHFVGGVALGAGLLVWRFVTSSQPLVRQRLKWAMWGAIVAAVPIVALQVARRFDYLPDDTLTVVLTTLPLGLISLSLGHSVVRYRLMDVDVVVRRALV